MSEKPLLSVETGRLRLEIFQDLSVPYPKIPKGTIFYEPCDDIIISGEEGTCLHSLEEFVDAARGYNIFRIQADKYGFFKYLDTYPFGADSCLGTDDAAIAFAPTMPPGHPHRVSEEESLFLESVKKYYGDEYTYFVLSEKCECCDQYKPIDSIYGCDGIAGALAEFRECGTNDDYEYKTLYDKALRLVC